MRKLISSLIIGSLCVVSTGCESNKFSCSRGNHVTPTVAQAKVTSAMPIAQTIHFGFDSDKLAADERENLDQIAGLIAERSEAMVRVEGYTDTRGPHRYNEGLGLRRAKSVVAYLTDKGINPNRFEVRSFGPDKVVDTTDNEVAHARNRRVEVIVAAVN